MAPTAATPVMGGIVDVSIRHENGFHFADLARFAVSEYNKNAVSSQPLSLPHEPICELGLIFYVNLPITRVSPYAECSG
jgi:hypothetical protein